MWSYSGCCTGHIPVSPAWCCDPYPAYYPYCLQFLPKEISADNSAPSAQATIGGAGSVLLSAEYVHDPGAASPSVKISIAEPTGTGDWEITTIPDGFQVKQDFITAAPGSTVKLNVSGCTARVKWFERIY